jgi:hypothetical protein
MLLDYQAVNVMGVPVPFLAEVVFDETGFTDSKIGR